MASDKDLSPAMETAVLVAIAVVIIVALLTFREQAVPSMLVTVTPWPTVTPTLPPGTIMTDPSTMLVVDFRPALTVGGPAFFLFSLWAIFRLAVYFKNFGKETDAAQEKPKRHAENFVLGDDGELLPAEEKHSAII